MTLIPVRIYEPVLRVDDVDGTRALLVSGREDHVTRDHVEQENGQLTREALEGRSTFAANGVVFTLGDDGNQIWIQILEEEEGEKGDKK